jgi:LPS sulfotransferase NodH
MSSASDSVPSPTRFVIVATQRTGSTWLADTLDAHPAVAAYEELFLPPEGHRRTWGRADMEFFYAYYERHSTHHTAVSRAFWSLRYLEELYSPRPDTEAIGIKLMYGQLKANPWLLAYLPLRRVRVVHLVRENLLDIVLSQRAAEARSQYHALESDPVDRSAVTLQTDTLVARLESLERSVSRTRRLLKAVPTPCLEISYEELATRHEAIDRVLRFLGVSVRGELVSKFRKLNTEGKRALIANFPEVEKALAGTRFERLLTG